jgi:uncharacterized damage-inducible protein DinB
MKPSSLLLVCLMVCGAIPICAQSSGAAADAITGTWIGQMGPGTTPQFTITLELIADGKGAVSGTVAGLPIPGEVKSGTFDSQTGALKLEAAPLDGSATRLVLEGTVVLGTATGRVSGGNQTGTFKITKKGSAASAPTPQSGANDAAAGLRAGFGEVSGWVIKAAELVPTDKYSYRPVATVRTFGQQIAHIADSYSYYCGRATGQKVQWSDAVEKGGLDKATLAQKLKQATDACTAVYGGNNQAGALMVNIVHTNLHYGNVITYLRMLGLTPPSN